MIKCPRPRGEQYNMTHIKRHHYKTGHNLTITCNQGYQAVGITEIMCSNDSTWVPALPNCVPGNCQVVTACCMATSVYNKPLN